MAYDKFAAVDSSTLLFPPSVRGNLAGVSPNYIINGDFSINQRAFSSTTTTGAYGFDRWFLSNTGGTGTYSSQTFTAGTAPVAGYEAQNFARVISSGQTATNSLTTFSQRIESVRTLANQTATISFWAKANSGTPKVSVEVVQNFGSGGSPSAAVNTYAGQVTLSTSWARYSVTVAVPSISGKTIGTDANSSYLQLQLWVSAGTDFNARTNSLGIQSNTFDFWGMQVEKGAVATPFRRNANSLQGELAACQRYYWRAVAGTSVYHSFAPGVSFNTTTDARIIISNPVEMRINPTSVEYSTLGLTEHTAQYPVNSLTLNSSGKLQNVLNVASSGLTTYRAYWLNANNSTAAYIGFSAEL